MKFSKKKLKRLLKHFEHKNSGRPTKYYEERHQDVVEDVRLFQESFKPRFPKIVINTRGSEILKKVDSQIKSAQSRFERDLNDAHMRIGKTNKRIENTDKKILSTNEKIDGTNKKIFNTNLRISNTNQRISSVDDKFSETDRRLFSTNERISDTDARVSDVNDELDVVDKRISKNRERIFGTGLKVDDNKGIILSTNERIAIANEKIADAAKRIFSTNQRISDTNTRVSNVKDELSNTGKRISDIDSKTGKRIFDTNLKISNTNKRVSDVLAEEVELGKQIEELRSQDKEFGKDLNVDELRLYNLFSDFNALKEEVDEHEGDFEDYEDVINSKLSMIEREIVALEARKPIILKREIINIGEGNDKHIPQIENTIMAEDRKVDKLQHSLIVMQKKLNQMIDIKTEEDKMIREQYNERLEQIDRTIKKFEVKLVRLQNSKNNKQLKPLTTKINQLKKKYSQMSLQLKTKSEFTMKPLKLKPLPSLPDDIPVTKKASHKRRNLLPSSLELPDIGEGVGSLDFDLPEPVPRMQAPRPVQKVQAKHHKKGVFDSFKKMLHIGS